MKINTQDWYSIQIKRLIVFLFFAIIAGDRLTGQVPAVVPNDTILTNQTSIPLGYITIKSAEVMIKTKQEILDLIPAGSILKLRIKNNEVLASIDQGLFENIDQNDASKNIRFLEKRRVALLQEQQKIEEQKAELTGVNDYLNSFKEETANQLALWENTRKIMEEDSLNPVVSLRVIETISFLDSTLILISNKSNSLVGILDQTIAKGIEIETHLEKIRTLIIIKRAGSLAVDHDPFFRLNFRTNYLKEISESFKLKTTVELVELKNYISKQLGSLFLTFLIFCGLFYFFIRLRARITIRSSGYGFMYKEKVMKVISNPGSVAILLALFSTGLIFPDRPLIFKEISIYIITFPLIQILSKLLDEKFRSYLYAYGGLIVFYLMLLLVSNETVLYRFLLLFIAAAEIFLLSYLLFNYDRKKEMNQKIKYFIDGFAYLHIGFAVVGLFSNITGRITLTEIIIGAVFLNIFNLLILRITSLTINGLIAIWIDSKQGRKINIFKRHGEIIKHKFINLINALAGINWVILTLRNFSLFDSIYRGFTSFFTHKYTVFSTSFSLDSIFIFFLVIYIAILLSDMIRILLEEEVLNRFSLSKGLPHSIAMVLKYTLVAAGFFLAINAAGIPVDRITIILGAMSVGIGFGLQNIFNNLVSGLILLFERPIQLGDTVQVGLLTGNVKSIGLRSSNVTTFEGAEVIVPNGQLVSNEVINWTLSDQKRRLEISVGVAYGSDPEKVHILLNGIINNHPDLLQDPEPLVVFSDLGESALKFTLYFWIADYNMGRQIKSDILFSIFRVLKENNIEIPFPQRDLHLRSVDQGIRLSNNLQETTGNKDGEASEK